MMSALPWKPCHLCLLCLYYLFLPNVTSPFSCTYKLSPFLIFWGWKNKASVSHHCQEHSRHTLMTCNTPTFEIYSVVLNCLSLGNCGNEGRVFLYINSVSFAPCKESNPALTSQQMPSITFLFLLTLFYKNLSLWAALWNPILFARMDAV